MSASYADALLAYAIRAVEAKKTMEMATKIERAYDSPVEERLEKGPQWLEELERPCALLV